MRARDRDAFRTMGARLPSLSSSSKTWACETKQRRLSSVRCSLAYGLMNSAGGCCLPFSMHLHNSLATRQSATRESSCVRPGVTRAEGTEREEHLKAGPQDLAKNQIVCETHALGCFPLPLHPYASGLHVPTPLLSCDTISITNHRLNCCSDHTITGFACTSYQMCSATSCHS